MTLNEIQILSTDDLSLKPFLCEAFNKYNNLMFNNMNNDLGTTAKARVEFNNS